MSEPDKKISAICLAVCSKNANMSIFAFHKYYITSLSPVFHTGLFRVNPMVEVDPKGKVDPVWGIDPIEGVGLMEGVDPMEAIHGGN